MFKCYRQLEYSDCGLSCIRMIAKHYGVEIPLKVLKSFTDLNRLGLSVKDIETCCRKICLKAIGVKIGGEKLYSVPLPAIIYWRQGHFVVLYKIDKKRKIFYVADPAEGKVRYDEEFFLKCWLPSTGSRGIVIVCGPTEGFSSIHYPHERPLWELFNYIFSYIRKSKSPFSVILLLSLTIIAADFAIPLLLTRTVDVGIREKDINFIVLLLLGQLGVFVGSIVSACFFDYFFNRIGLTVNKKMMGNFLRSLIKFPISFFDRRVSSDFIEKTEDQTRIKDFLLDFPDTVLVMCLNLLVFSVLLWKYSPEIFVFFFLISFLEIGWTALFVNKRKSLNYATFVNSSENRTHIFELTNGLPELKVNNAEEIKLKKWEELQDRINVVGNKRLRLNFSHNMGKNILSRCKELLVTGISAIMVINGDMSIGVMMTLGYITARLSQPFSMYSTSLNTLQDALISFQRVGEILNPTFEKKGERKIEGYDLWFSGLWFKYPGNSSPFVIKNLDLSIESGSMTALVGESGSGKSTLIKLMLGFHNPSKGDFKIGNIPIQEIDIQDWLSHCGVVMQGGKVFTSTILENIAMSDESPDLENVLSVLESVGLKEFVDSLPMGIHTRLGVSGLELSGGQVQRLLIARAMYKKPQVLFLDEATSSLDANNERIIVENIRRFKKGRTLIVAAHRLSTVMDADKIVFIKNGIISEQGTHQELVDKKGDYWKLVKNQLQLSSC